MKFKDLADSTLDDLAREFDNRKRSTTAGCGWGQFIDGAAGHTQVGPYGTSAGAIVISLARGADTTVARAAADLADQWKRYQQGDASQNKLFCQNPRLAWVYLALSLAGPNFQTTVDEIRRELLGRQLSSNRWGDWWIDGYEHDTVQRRFSTALVYFCLGHQGAGNLARQWANGQTVLPLSSYGFPTLDVVFHALAVLTNADDEKTQKSFRRELKSRDWRQLVDSRELGVYFYDFRFKNASAQIEDGREYFIVPIRLVGIIIGSMNMVPPLFKAATLSAASSVMTGMRAQQGVYREAEGARASSLNQAWAAMAISSASRLLPPRWGKALWVLVKERHSAFVDRYLPFLAIAVATGLAALAPDDPLSKGGAALCLLLLGWVYASKINRVLQVA